MTTILHIFRKDIRHLWPHASAVWILMALSAILDPTYSGSGPSLSFSLMSGFALPLACWNLVIAAIHEEKLPGDRQYWLTRPYRWKDLLAAKALLIAVCINAPLLIWHVWAFVAVGIPLEGHLRELLWRQFFFSALYILPLAAVGAITRNLGQVMLTALLVVLPVVFMGGFLFARLRLNWLNMEGTLYTAVAGVVTLGVAAVLIAQYSRRNTKLSRILFGALAVAVLGVATFGSKLAGGAPQRREDPRIRISLDEQAGRNSTILPSGRLDFVTLDIPLRFEGIPAGMDLMQKDFGVWIRGQNGHTLQASRGLNGGFHGVRGGTAWLTVSTTRYGLQWLGAHDAEVGGSAHFLAFGEPQMLPLPRGRSVVVPKVGVCSDTRDEKGQILLACYTPGPRASVAIASGDRLNWIIPQGMVDLSIPTSSELQPLMKYSSILPYRSWEDLRESHLMSAEPLPPVFVAFDLKGVDLTRYVVESRR